MSDTSLAFSDLSLNPSLLKALGELGYETPSPIQSACIPLLQAGKDVLGTAQTGTGKTAAFALPLLDRIDLSLKSPQVLVLTPTRELAIQVAEAFQAYARHMPGFHVLPIYGGQNYGIQMKQIGRNPQVIVGTPGRLLDHLSRKSFSLANLKTLVLDEADEMLRMGFIDDVETIMAQTPAERQTALFSATMPAQIQRITKDYMRDPQQVKIASKTSTVENIEQSYWIASGVHKLDALSRILETEDYDGVIVFARTKTATVELAEKLEARGYSSSALNGDMNQALRERTVSRFKSGGLDILIATDVAARGLDVDRISLVVNYDIPYDTESYVHRIGRTGRAGRQGKAILFITNRERHLLRAIERATRQKINPRDLPSSDAVTQKRVKRFAKEVESVITDQKLDFFRDLSLQIQDNLGLSAEELNTALLFLAQKEKPLQMPAEKIPERRPRDEQRDSRNPRDRNARGRDDERPRQRSSKKREDIPHDTYRLEAGRDHGIQVKHIVGAIANEADLESRFIGDIVLHDDYSTVQLPEGMPVEKVKHLQGVRVCGRPMRLQKVDGAVAPRRSRKPRPPRD